MATALRSVSDLSSHNLREQDTAERRDSAAVPADFVLIYREYAPHIYRYCYRCLGSKEDAEDATSQVFTQALVNLHRLRDGNVRPWLYRIAHNVVIDHTRRRKPVVHLDCERGGLPLVSGTESEFELQELREVLDHALSSLCERDQQLVFLRLAGLAGAEIADVLNCSHGAVRVAHHRALDRLREVLIAQGNADV